MAAGSRGLDVAEESIPIRMNVCMYVCMHVSIYVHVSMYMYVCIVCLNWLVFTNIM